MIGLVYEVGRSVVRLRMVDRERDCWGGDEMVMGRVSGRL